MREETQALVVQNGNQALDFGIQAVVSVDQALKRIKELQSFMAAVMVKGEDYGVIPGTGSKPTLLKPGAEKLCEMYGLTPTFDITDSVRDWEAPFFHYEVRCRLVSKNTGVIMGEGLGSCNSREKRYRNQDTYSIANTILKMAKKRAHVDAALSATRSSGIFTQDIEDFVDDTRATSQPAPPRQQGGQQKATAARKLSPEERERGEARYEFLKGKVRGMGGEAIDIDRSWDDETLTAGVRALVVKLADLEENVAQAAG